MKTKCTFRDLFTLTTNFAVSIFMLQGLMFASAAFASDEVKFSASKRFSGRKAVVLIAQGVRCPVMRQNYPGYLALQKEFEPQNVAFLFINANPQDTPDEIKNESRTYGLENEIEIDENQRLVREASLTTVGEAAVLVPQSNDNWRVVYRGGINDRVNFDRALAKPKHEYLRNALADVVANRNVARSKAPVFGCAITFK